MRKIFDYLFGCTHAHTTFPRARKDRTGKVILPVRSYVACVDCGAELEYGLFDRRHPAEAGAIPGRLLPESTASYGFQPAPRL